MGSLTYKDVYIEDGKRILEINILPKKYCNFDCVFCPIGRAEKTDKQVGFDDYEDVITELTSVMDRAKPDLIFINSKGEAFINEKLAEIINFIKSKNIQVRLLTNGYLLGEDKYKKIANICDEVIGEIKVARNEDFQKLQRPIAGYTLEEHIDNMAGFTKQYKGKFIFEITIVKGYNDDSESVEKLRKMIQLLSPAEIHVVGIEDEPFKKKLGVSEERLKEITKTLTDDEL